MMRFSELLNRDYIRYKKSSGSKLKMFLFHPGFRFMVFFRLCNRFSFFHPVGMVSRVWYKRMQVKYGLQIPHTVSIGGGLFLAHFGGIVINAKAVIGNNCNIAQGVTIGQVSAGDKAGVPIIGDRVFFGPYAAVVGNVEIGDDALIAPLSYVNFSVPARSVVMGNPAKIVGDKGSAGYINSYEP